MRKPNQQKARSTAQALLRDFGAKAAPVPVEKIIKSLNIVLQYAPLEGDLSGMAYIKDGIGIIGVNALHHPNRQRFSTAHELGHHVLHADEIRRAIHVDKGRVLYRGDLSSQGTDPLEIEANAFAAELLMPSELLMDAIGKNGLDIEDDASVEALARKFRVSAGALRWRLAGGWFKA